MYVLLLFTYMGPGEALTLTRPLVEISTWSCQERLTPPYSHGDGAITVPTVRRRLRGTAVHPAAGLEKGDRS